MHSVRIKPSMIRFLCISSLLAGFAVPAMAFEDKQEPAIGGYDPVAYFTAKAATKGDAAQQAKYLGKTYYFSSEENKKKFEAEPAKFVPQYDSLCTTALGGTYGNRLPSDPTVFDVRDDKLYLFSQERAKRAYEKNPENFIKQGNERFNKPAVGGYCVVTSQKEGKGVKGDPQFNAVYKNWMYHFASAAAVEEFRKDPQKYLPQYENWCATGISRGKAFPTDGTRLRVVNGKTYLLFGAEEEKVFDEDTAGTIKKADENWPKVKAEKEAEKNKSREPKKGP